MKCPYRNFEECLYLECPAYIPDNKSTNIMLHQKETCRFVINNNAPKHSIANNLKR